MYGVRDYLQFEYNKHSDAPGETSKRLVLKLPLNLSTAEMVVEFRQFLLETGHAGEYSKATENAGS